MNAGIQARDSAGVAEAPKDEGQHKLMGECLEGQVKGRIHAYAYSGRIRPLDPVQADHLLWGVCCPTFSTGC